MKVLMSLGIVITLALVGGSAEAKAAGCEAIGNVRFMCDQLGPEDLAAVPASDWVRSSGMAATGAIRLISLRDKSTTVLFPSAASRERPNKKTYESCPGPIGSEGEVQSARPISAPWTERGPYALRRASWRQGIDRSFRSGRPAQDADVDLDWMCGCARSNRLEFCRWSVRRRVFSHQIFAPGPRGGGR